MLLRNIRNELAILIVHREEEAQNAADKHPVSIIVRKIECGVGEFVEAGLVSVLLGMSRIIGMRRCCLERKGMETKGGRTFLSAIKWRVRKPDLL
jgi:hypothetical protein